MLVAPSGVMETDDSSKLSHCSWVYTRVDMSKPVLCLPTKDKYTTAVRFSPKLYKLRSVKTSNKEVSDPDKPWLAAKSLFALPYRCVYAVATQNAIMFYDTQQVAPFGRVSNVHYTGLTDLSWSPCGNILFASSSDGYCSIVTFAPGEIGEIYVDKNVEETTNGTESSKNEEKVKVVKDVKSGDSEATNKAATEKSNAKRLQFITLSSPKANKKMNKVTPKEAKESDKMEMNLDGDFDNLGVERMDTDNDELNLVLEETQPEPPAPTKAPVEVKKRVPLTTIIAGSNAGSSTAATCASAATPEKTKKRVNLITLSSPKPKS